MLVFTSELGASQGRKMWVKYGLSIAKSLQIEKPVPILKAKKDDPNDSE